MWLQYSIGGIGGLLAGLASFYLLEELVIERERRSNTFLVVCMGMGVLVGLSGAYLMKSVSTLLLTIIFGNTLFIGATIDKQYLILPDEGAIILLISGLSRMWLIEGTWAMALVCAALVWLVGYLLRYFTTGGLGLGDIKWCSIFAFWLSPMALWYAIVLAFVGGTVWLFAYAIIRKRIIHILPFGPFLCTAVWLMYIWEQGGRLL